MEKIKDTVTGEMVEQPKCKHCKNDVGSELICICRDCAKLNIKHKNICKCDIKVKK